MQRWTALVLALLFGGAVALLVAQPGTGARPRAAVAAPSAPPSSSARLPVTAPVATAPTQEPAPARSGWVLPEDAPKTVGFGVIQIPYQGAQFAQSSTVTKQEAMVRAQALLSEAQRDFASAVKKGDAASGEDLGDIPRGVLEPEAEYVLFTMKVGEIHGALLDTPRGFWIVRRTR